MGGNVKENAKEQVVPPEKKKSKPKIGHCSCFTLQGGCFASLCLSVISSLIVFFVFVVTFATLCIHYVSF